MTPDEPTTPSEPTLPRWWSRLRSAAVTAGLSAATVGLISAASLYVHAAGRWGVVARAAVVTGPIMAAAAVYGRHRATRAAAALAELTEAARDGRVAAAALDDVARAYRGFDPLVLAVRGLLLDLRQERQAIATLERETMDRVANRTDALQRQLGSLRWQASRDPLTGLLNRRALDAELPRLVDRYRQTGADVCLLALDVDRFKLLNDALGHAAGDAFLRDVGQIIRSTVDSAGDGAEAAFRLGGDEFVVVLPDRGIGPGRATGERLTSLVAALAATLPLRRPPGLSVGGCAASEFGSTVTADKLLAVADGRLYAAKAARGSTRRAA